MCAFMPFSTKQVSEVYAGSLVARYRKRARVRCPLSLLMAPPGGPRTKHSKANTRMDLGCLHVRAGLEKRMPARHNSERPCNHVLPWSGQHNKVAILDTALREDLAHMARRSCLVCSGRARARIGIDLGICEPPYGTPAHRMAQRWLVHGASKFARSGQPVDSPATRPQLPCIQLACHGKWMSSFANHVAKTRCHSMAPGKSDLCLRSIRCAISGCSP